MHVGKQTSSAALLIFYNLSCKQSYSMGWARGREGVGIRSHPCVLQASSFAHATSSPALLKRTIKETVDAENEMPGPVGKWQRHRELSALIPCRPRTAEELSFSIRARKPAAFKLKPQLSTTPDEPIVTNPKPIPDTEPLNPGP